MVDGIPVKHFSRTFVFGSGLEARRCWLCRFLDLTKDMAWHCLGGLFYSFLPSFIAISNAACIEMQKSLIYKILVYPINIMPYLEYR